MQVLETQSMPIWCLHGFCSKWEQFRSLGSCLCLLALLWGTVSETGWPSRTVLSFSFAICLMVVSVYVFKIPIWITWTKEIKSSGKTGKELFCRIAKEGKTWCKGQLEGIKSNVAALSFPVIELASKDQQHEAFWYLKFHVNLNTDFYESHFSTASKKRVCFFCCWHSRETTSCKLTDIGWAFTVGYTCGLSWILRYVVVYTLWEIQTQVPAQ